MTITVGQYRFNHASYDVTGDVLYLRAGELRPAADTHGTPEGHAVRLDQQGNVIGITIVNAKWLIEREVATLRATASVAAQAGTTAGTPPCTTAGLVVWLDTQGNGAAGSTYYKLEFTNQSRHTCRLGGFPGVSAVDLSGNQLGSAATRDRTRGPRTVRLASGDTATAGLRIVRRENSRAPAAARRARRLTRLPAPTEPRRRSSRFHSPVLAYGTGLPQRAGRAGDIAERWQDLLGRPRPELRGLLERTRRTWLASAGAARRRRPERPAQQALGLRVERLTCLSDHRRLGEPQIYEPGVRLGVEGQPPSALTAAERLTRGVGRTSEPGGAGRQIEHRAVPMPGPAPPARALRPPGRRDRAP